MERPLACSFIAPAVNARYTDSPVIPLMVLSAGILPCGASWQDAQRSLYMAAPSCAEARTDVNRIIGINRHTYRIASFLLSLQRKQTQRRPRRNRFFWPAENR